MAEILTVSMNKGGVGKTTLATNLAGAISKIKKDKKILIIDTDGQGNSAISFGYNPSDFEDSIYDVFMGTKSIDDVTVKIDENVYLVPANDDMSFLEFEILPKIKEYEKPFYLLKDAVDKIRDKYDYIILDTPPAMGLVMFNSLVASDKVILPFLPEAYNVKGLIRVVDAINNFKTAHNPSLQIAGVVGMMIDKRTNLHGLLLRNAKDYCKKNGVHFYKTTIPRSIIFANAVTYDEKPATWERRGKAVEAYIKLAKEVAK